ncbi:MULTISPECIES: hypothetical protein [unclassified Gordonia (in: high G+C Gram-positive bacteria)]|uniref:hypothetical protein n=1 Tax=unclassified Gordonia (in: high G+C Gram-positive bacteria) TaxID=2657482 RepID=UPI0009912C8E|nr:MULTISPECIES: hypothetical protein [unclassified Gordonia (in: high G+C Gram-positive bacteria)]MBR7192835.1 hypothetical protein [Gordonia sp. SCSIO 19800]MCX2753430.1 hypothetical protein [Gordonia sp. 4N]
MRGKSGAVVALFMGTVIVAMGVIVTLAVPRSVDGHAAVVADSAATTDRSAVDDRYPDVDPLATTPTPRWSADMSDIAGLRTPDTTRVPTVLAADRQIVVGGPTSASVTELMAFDAADGRQLWPETSAFRAETCALSRDGRLACLRRGSAPTTVDLGFIAVGTGAVTATKSFEIADGPQDPTLASAGNGFLVTSRRFVETEAVYAATLNWFSSDGSHSWVQRPPVGLSDPELSESGNVVAVSDYKRGARVYALDTGTVLYDSAQDLEPHGGPGGSAIIQVAVARPGFAVSILTSARTTTVYDDSGTLRGTIDGVVLPFAPSGSEGDLIPVTGTDVDNRQAIGAASLETLEVVALTAFAGSLLGTELLGGQYVAGSETTGSNSEEWVVLDLDKPQSATTMAAGNNRLLAFDGVRAVFADRFGSNYGVPQMVAYELSSGREVWTLGNPDGEREYRFVGPYLFQVITGVAGESGSLRLLDAKP